MKNQQEEMEGDRLKQVERRGWDGERWGEEENINVAYRIRGRVISTMSESLIIQVVGRESMTSQTTPRPADDRPDERRATHRLILRSLYMDHSSPIFHPSSAEAVVLLFFCLFFNKQKYCTEGKFCFASSRIFSE